MISNPGLHVSPERHFYLHLIDLAIESEQKREYISNDFVAEAARATLMYMARMYAAHFCVIS